LTRQKYHGIIYLVVKKRRKIMMNHPKNGYSSIKFIFDA